MKKIKKILATVMTLAMVLGMSMTTMAAAVTPSITVKGLTVNENTQVSIYQLINWDAAENEWVKTDFVQNLETTNKANYVTISENNGTVSVQWNALYNAVIAAGDSIEADAVDTTTSGEITFNKDIKLGDYLVIAKSLVSGDETVTVYSPMGAQTYDYPDSNGNLITGKAATIYAKGSGYPLNKTLSENSINKVVGLGDTICFDITTVFPSYDKDSTNREFYITDSPTGLKITGVTVYVNNVLVDSDNYTISPELSTIAADTDVVVSFTSEYLNTEGDSHSGQPVKVVVEAEVTDAENYSNTAWSNFFEKPEQPQVTGETGSIVITKTDKDNNTLSGAEFQVKNSDDEILKFAYNEETQHYEYVTTTMDSEEEGITVTSNDNGLVTIVGLTPGTYELTETKAPDGYAIKHNIPEVTVPESGTAQVEVTVIDDTLASLPETGGIGTTIFTVGGCIIMIAAAGLFFASRRKSSK